MLTSTLSVMTEDLKESEVRSFDLFTNYFFPLILGLNFCFTTSAFNH